MISLGQLQVRCPPPRQRQEEVCVRAAATPVRLERPGQGPWAQHKIIGTILPYEAGAVESFLQGQQQC